MKRRELIIGSLSWLLLVAMRPAEPAQEGAPDGLEQRWDLDHYSLFGFSYDPDDEERNDYIHLHADGSYSSISEGNYEEGRWSYTSAKKAIALSKRGEQGQLLLIIEKLSSERLVVHIEDPNDSDTKYLKIHFNSRP